MRLTKIETETVINFNDGEKDASISTRQKSVKTKLAKLGVVPHHTQADYEVYIVPKTWIKFRKGRILSEKEKETIRLRMQNVRKAKTA